MLYYSEFVMALQEGFVRKDEVRQKMLIDELISTALPFFLGLIQQVLKDNGGKYLVGSEVWFSKNFEYIVQKINIDLCFHEILFSASTNTTTFTLKISETTSSSPALPHVPTSDEETTLSEVETSVSSIKSSTGNMISDG